MATYFEEDYRNNHNFQWALSMAKQGCHCGCSQLKPGERLVYTTKASVRTYDDYGITQTERPVPQEAKKCYTWALWQDD